MSDQPISRRDALMAATVLGAVAATGHAQDGLPAKEPLQRPPAVGGTATAPPTPLKLQITLTDGQVVSFNASQAVITFPNSGSLLATRSGIVPMANNASGILPVERRSAIPNVPEEERPEK